MLVSGQVLVRIEEALAAALVAGTGLRDLRMVCIRPAGRKGYT
jgi:hypothetical protein